MSPHSFSAASSVAFIESCKLELGSLAADDPLLDKKVDAVIDRIELHIQGIWHQYAEAIKRRRRVLSNFDPETGEVIARGGIADLALARALVGAPHDLFGRICFVCDEFGWQRPPTPKDLGQGKLPVIGIKGAQNAAPD